MQPLNVLKTSPIVEKYSLLISNFNLIKSVLDGAEAVDDSYLTCPAYYLLTGRKGGYFLVSRGQVIVVCNHPHKKDTAIIMPEIGRNSSWPLTQSVLNMQNSSSQQLIFGKLSNENAIALSSQLGLSFTPVFDTSMDWVYPVRIHSTHIVAGLEGARFRKIRNRVAAATKSGIRLKPINRDDAPILQAHARAELIGRGNVGEISYHKRLCELLQYYPMEFSGLSAVDSNNKTVGFIIWRVASPNVANIYSHVADRSMPGTSDFLLCAACRTLCALGIKWINVGGSEEYSLDQYKQKFQPEFTIIQGSFEYAKAI